MPVISLVLSDSPTLISSLLRLSAHHLALAALASQPLKSGTLSLCLSIPVPVRACMCVDLPFQVECRIICLYRKPGFGTADHTYMYDCVRCLQRLCSTDKLTIITGNCNLPDIDWSC